MNKNVPSSEGGPPNAAYPDRFERIARKASCERRRSARVGPVDQRKIACFASRKSWVQIPAGPLQFHTCRGSNLLLGPSWTKVWDRLLGPVRATVRGSCQARSGLSRNEGGRHHNPNRRGASATNCPRRSIGPCEQALFLRNPLLDDAQELVEEVPDRSDRNL